MQRDPVCREQGNCPYHSIVAYINVETPTGTLALKKTSEDGLVEGMKFHLYGTSLSGLKVAAASS